VRILISVGIVFIASVLMAGEPAANTAIGVVRSSGDFNVDGSLIRNNATLFNGAVVETRASASHTTLRDGTKLDLGTASRARVYSDHALLEQGTTQVRGATHFQVMTSHLQVFSKEPFQVSLTQPGHVAVVALEGFAEVKNAQGILVARVMPGSPLEFQEAGASAPTQVSGCLHKKDNHYVIYVSATGTEVEIIGTDLEQYVGKQVDVTGSVDTSVTPVAGATQVIQVANLKAGSGAGCKPVAAAGMSGGAKAAIIGGIAVVGIIGGLAAAGTFSSSTPTAPVSTP